VTLADSWTLSELARAPDELKDFRFSSAAARRVAQAIADGKEVYWSAGNGSGKSTLLAALALAIARGWPELDGVKLPRFSQPTLGLLIVPSLGQASGSSIAALRRMLGRHPHREGPVSGTRDLVGRIWVKPDGWLNDDYETWSAIVLIPHGGEVPEGYRADFWAADEPPEERVIRAARFRFKPGRPFLGFIFATPLEELGWRWLMRDDEFGKCLNKERNGKLRIQSSVYECLRSTENPLGHLSPSDIERAEKKALGDPQGAARLSGQHVFAGAGCPFPREGIELWASRCTDGELKRYVIQTEQDSPTGRRRVEVAVSVESWAPPDEREEYLVVVDPSGGIEGQDPGALEVWARRRRALVALYDGYLQPWGLGSLAAAVAREYRNALVDVEAGGWGSGVLSSLREAGYHRLSREIFVEKPGTIEQTLGWKTTASSRPKMIAALQRAIAKDDAAIWSRKVVQTLSECIMDASGKILAGPGGHDEHLILAARALHVMDTRPIEPYNEPRRDIAFRQALARMNGQSQRREAWALPEAW
jgi:hypothetical protein